MTPEQACRALGFRVLAWCLLHVPPRALALSQATGRRTSQTQRSGFSPALVHLQCPSSPVRTQQTTSLTQRPGIGSESEEKDPRARLLAHFTG